jgi:hypothetical protein
MPSEPTCCCGLWICRECRPRPSALTQKGRFFADRVEQLYAAGKTYGGALQEATREADILFPTVERHGGNDDQ